MKILLIAATALEIQSFLNDGQVDVLICDVGSPVTVYHLTKKLSENKYDIIIQAGIGGTFTKKIKTGEVVIIKQDAFGDIGVEEKEEFKTVFQLGFGDENKFPFDKGWLKNTNEILNNIQLKKVNGITVNKISDKKKQTKQLIKKFKAAVESMEGAAFHYVCLMEKVPFLQVRSISNKVGERDKKKWRIQEAIENLNEELEIIFTYLNRNN